MTSNEIKVVEAFIAANEKQHLPEIMRSFIR
jgi:hypothetical protein